MCLIQLVCVDRTPTYNTHLCSTVCSQARNAHHALGSSNHGLHFIFVRLKIVLSSGLIHVSLFVVLSPAVYHEHIIFLIHSSSTTTQEHAAQPVQQEELREHPVHHSSLRHQESLWRENLQSCGNPRTTTPTKLEHPCLSLASLNFLVFCAMSLSLQLEGNHTSFESHQRVLTLWYAAPSFEVVILPIFVSYELRRASTRKSFKYHPQSVCKLFQSVQTLPT